MKPIKLWGARSGKPKSDERRSGFSKVEREIDRQYSRQSSLKRARQRIGQA